MEFALFRFPKVGEDDPSADDNPVVLQFEIEQIGEAWFKMTSGRFFSASCS